MTKDEIDELVPRLNRLMVAHSAAKRASAGGVVDVMTLDLEDLLKHGAYPPDNPISGQALELKAISEELERMGGSDLNKRVIAAYGRKFGAQEASRLRERWGILAGE